MCDNHFKSIIEKIGENIHYKINLLLCQGSTKEPLIEVDRSLKSLNMSNKRIVRQMPKFDLVFLLADATEPFS